MKQLTFSQWQSSNRALDFEAFILFVSVCGKDIVHVIVTNDISLEYKPRDGGLELRMEVPVSEGEINIFFRWPDDKEKTFELAGKKYVVRLDGIERVEQSGNSFLYPKFKVWED